MPAISQTMILHFESAFPGTTDSLKKVDESSISEMETKSGITGKKTESVVSVSGKSEMAGKATESVISEAENKSSVFKLLSSLSEKMIGL